MKLGLVPGGKVFSYIGESTRYVKVEDVNIYLLTPPVDPAQTELAVQINGNGKLFRCSHNMEVTIHPDEE